MTENSSKARAAAGEALQSPVRDAVKAPQTAMLFTATGWTFNVRLGRSGREESEGIIIVGEVTFRGQSGERQLRPARAMVVKADARKRLDLNLSAHETVLTVPLEPFALQRLQERLKDLVSNHRMTLRVAFSASETLDRQGLDSVDFAFSSSGKPGDRDG
jgi:hypothetical protein